jgi:threonine dehydrogenase-like Zn-dependent dehydrogenase
MPQRLAMIGSAACRLMPYEERPLGPGEVRVRTAFATGKYGTNATLGDGQTIAGWTCDARRLFVPDPAAGIAIPTPEKPAGSGNCGTGTVSEVGPGVGAWKVGDEVYGPMDIRQTNVCSADWLFARGGLDHPDALCVESAFVAFHCLREGAVRLGDTVAVVGLGPLGLAAVVMARSAGAERIIAVDPSPGRRALALTLGADDAVDGRAGDPAAAVHDLTGGPGVDVAIELSGVYAGLATAIRSTRVCGTVVAAGFYGGESKGLWLGREFHHNRLTLVVPHGCGWGHPPRDLPRWDDQRAWRAIGSLAGRGMRLGRIITHTVPLARSEGVFALLRDQPDVAVKFAVDLRA